MQVKTFGNEAPPTTVAIADGSRFAVRRIYCVGRNYADHIREMGGDERALPFFFQKPTDCIVEHGATVTYPTVTSDFQHEVELVLAIGREGANISREEAAGHVFGIAVGIDLTRRDVQIEARKVGRPWEIGKSFDESAPCGTIKRTDGAPLPNSGQLQLLVNGEVRQSGDLAQMIWAADEIVSQLSTQYRLMPGDLIYTGTPAGVSALKSGDVVQAELAGVERLVVTVA